jgi:hypothetical protein
MSSAGAWRSTMRRLHASAAREPANADLAEQSHSRKPERYQCRARGGAPARTLAEHPNWDNSSDFNAASRVPNHGPFWQNKANAKTGTFPTPPRKTLAAA